MSGPEDRYTRDCLAYEEMLRRKKARGENVIPYWDEDKKESKS
jgi:hypothetical protein